MNNLRSKFYPIFQSLIFCALILFAFNFINEKPFIRMYKWPNFGDNYLAGLMFVSLFLIKKSLIKFNRSDKFFILIILYVGLMELFYFENDGLYRYSLMRDLFGIFYVFKVLGFIGIENIVEKLIKYSSIIFILLAIPYFVIYFSLHYYEYKFESIYYIDATLKNYFFFQVFFLFSICCFFQKKVLAIIFYFLCALILFYFPSRGQLLLFIIAIVPILLRYKFRIFFLAAHFIFTYLVFFAEYKESIKNTIVTKEVYVESVEAIKKNDRSVIARKDRHGELNSTITRMHHLEINLEKLKKNIIFGSGYSSVKNNDFKIIAKTCECLILHPLFSYGLIGQVFLLILIFFLFKDYNKHFKDIDSKLLLFSVILIFVIYSIATPLFPAWFGIGFFLLINQNKNEEHDLKFVSK